MRSSTACTSGTTSSPSTTIRSPAGARSATCRTARSSVTLIFWPLNMASIRSAQAALLGQPEEEPERLVGDAVLGVVEVEAGGLGGQALAPRRGRRRRAPAGAGRGSRGSAPPAPSTPGARVSGWAGGFAVVIGLPPPARCRCASVARFASRHSRRSFQDLSKDAVPSRWSRAASAAIVHAGPRELGEHRLGVAAVDGTSRRPRGRGRRRPARVFSGIVLMVSGAASAST